jgi:hypothetical protein
MGHEKDAKIMSTLLFRSSNTLLGLNNQGGDGPSKEWRKNIPLIFKKRYISFI